MEGCGNKPHLSSSPSKPLLGSVLPTLGLGCGAAPHSPRCCCSGCCPAPQSLPAEHSPGRNQPHGTDHSRDEQTQEGTLLSFAQAVSRNKTKPRRENKETTSPSLSHRHSLDTERTLQLRVVKRSKIISNATIWDYVNSVSRGQGVISGLLPTLHY